MNFAGVYNGGQVKIPPEILKRLNIKDGDRLAFVEQNGRYYLANSNASLFEYLQESFCGEAEKAGLKDENDVVRMVKEMRMQKAGPLL